MEHHWIFNLDFQALTGKVYIVRRFLRHYMFVCLYCASLIAPFESLHGEATPNAKNSTKIPMIDG
jgi:hypothetical protein